MGGWTDTVDVAMQYTALTRWTNGRAELRGWGKPESKASTGIHSLVS